MGTEAASSGVVPNTRLNRQKAGEFLDAALAYKAESEWKGDKRFYITFLPHVDEIAQGTIEDRREVINFNIRTTLTGSYDNISGAKRIRSLAELSTAEIITHNSTDHSMVLSKDFPLQQQYIARRHINTVESIHNHSATPPFFVSGSWLVSKNNDENPSLLVELDKDVTLSKGLGDNGFVVIPDNLHPFIKDNIEYFLIRAGLNVSGDASQFLELDETNRNLP